MTHAGIILGTAAYMSPEQASGKPVDKRTDIWSFGVLLLETLTGRQVFKGETVSHVLASVLKDEPNWAALPSDTPAPIRRLLRRCLEKDRKRRLESAADVRLEIEDALASPALEEITPGPVRRIAPIAIGGVVSGVLLAALVGVGLVARLNSRTSSNVPTRWALRLPRGVNFPVGVGFTTGMAVSPDGRAVALGGEQGGRTSIWVQTFDAVDAQPVAGTENFAGFVLFWSSDSRRLAFVADGKLKTIELATGALRTLCDAPAASGGTWNKAGVILLGMSGGGIVRVPEIGGDPVPVTKPDVNRNETIHRFPSFLPDGHHFLFLIQPNNTVAVGDVDSSEIIRLFEADSFARYATEKFVLFVRQGALVAQPFDAVRLRTTGEAVTVTEGVPANFQGGTGAFSVSDNGVLVVGHGASGLTRLAHLTWFDRSGQVIGPIGESVDYLGIEASPDGRRIATHQHELIGGGEIWIRDADRDTNTRLTAGGHNTGPVWSPDGARIAFGSNRPPSGAPFRDPYAGTFNLYEKPADADPATPPTLLLDSATAHLPLGWKQPTSWSRDGKYIVFEALNPKSAFDIYLLTLEGDHKVQPLLQTQFQEFEGQISPDGRWLAYTSDETLRQEVYVRPLTDVGGKRQISKAGGDYPRWRRDGRELFYIEPSTKRLMAVSVSPTSQFVAGLPQPIFDVKLGVGFQPPGNVNANATVPYPYIVSEDGKRFLVSVDCTESGRRCVGDRDLQLGGGPQEIEPLSVVHELPS